MPKVLGAETTIPAASTNLQPQQFMLSTPLQTTEVNAGHFFVYDIKTGQILAEKESYTKVSIASLTKLMTALLTYEHFQVNDLITVTSKDILTTTPLLRLRVGDTLRVGDVVNAMLVGSANDAASFLGRALTEKTGVPIADLMNQRAGALGMQDSQFQNPMGFDSVKHFSTAYDVHILVDAILRHQTFADLGHRANYSFTSTLNIPYNIRATNKLVQKDETITAIKTGYTNGAQGAMVTKFRHYDHDIAIIVLGSSDRDGDTARLKHAIEQSYVLDSIEPLE